MMKYRKNVFRKGNFSDPVIERINKSILFSITSPKIVPFIR